MKPGGIVNLGKFNSFVFFRKNKLFIFICFAFISGIVIGSLSLLGNSKSSVFADDLFYRYISDRRGISFFGVILNSLWKYFAVCLAFFIFGTSVTGIVFSPVLSCFLGVYYGIIAAFAYSDFALKGVAFNAIVLIPSSISFVICMFFAAKESFWLSVSFIKLIMPKSRPLNLSEQFRFYCGKFMIIISFLIVSSVVDAAISISFLKYFTF